MKFLFHLGHPAHFHLFKNSIYALRSKGHKIYILIKKKDILEDLLKDSGLEYNNILPHGRKDSKAGIALGMIQSDFKIFMFALKVKPDMMIGTSYAISHVGKLLSIPSVNLNEDDADVVPLYAKLSYPWATEILSPVVCNNGKWDNKSIKYNSYHELAYLHPNHFTPDKSVVRKYIDPDTPYFILRFAKLGAHHDAGIKGISDEIGLKIISLLKNFGNIIITSERKLSDDFETYRIPVKPLDMHHLMAFSEMYIGDSQTMAAEAGVLGVPFIRFNDFVGRIGYLNELEHVYKIGFGFKPNESDGMLKKINELLAIENRNSYFKSLKDKMLQDKIDLASFLIWFFENYPSSVDMIKSNPGYQQNFK